MWRSIDGKAYETEAGALAADKLLRINASRR
jgi:hypothetical protein